MAKRLELQWSQPYVVKDVAGFYRNMLPIIVQVEEGYSGITDEETYSRDDMWLITDVRQQKRVAATAFNERKNSTIYISIPVNSRAKFHIVYKDGKKTHHAQTMQQYDKQNMLKENTRLCPDETNPMEFRQCIGDGIAGKLGDLTITNVFQQDYLVGFPLPELHKPHEGTSIFPVHMDLKFKVAESLEGGRKNDFKHYMRRMKEQIKHFQHNSLIEGTTEIMLYSEEIAEEDPYEYLSPTDYVRFSQLQQSSAYGGVPAKQNESYDDATSSKGKSIRRAKAPDPESDSDYDDVEHLRKCPPPQSDEPEVKPTTDATCDPDTVSTNTAFDKEEDQGPVIDRKPVVKPRSLLSAHTGNKDRKAIPLPPKPTIKPRNLSSELLNPVRPDTTSDNTVQTTSNPIKQTQSIFKAKKRQVGIQLPNKFGEKNESQQALSSAKPTGLVSPMVQDQECIYKTFSEIPKDITPLTIHQIAACLKRMQMSKYIPQFEENQIDGALLLALTEDDLKNDFGMSAVESKKIWIFAHKQWRPKTT